MKRFAELSEQEVLALAITNEEEDCRIYLGFADGLREQYPTSAKLSVKLVKQAELKIYKGSPHGMTTTEKDKVNADLLAFVKG